MIQPVVSLCAQIYFVVEENRCNHSCLLLQCIFFFILSVDKDNAY